MPSIDVFIYSGKSNYQSNPGFRIARDRFENHFYIEVNGSAPSNRYRFNPENRVVIISLLSQVRHGKASISYFDQIHWGGHYGGSHTQEDILFFCLADRANELDTPSNSTLYSVAEFVERYGDFVTFFGKRATYDAVMSWLSEGMAISSPAVDSVPSLLLAINEIAALNLGGKKPALLKQALEYEPINAMLRYDNEAYISYISLGRILRKRQAGHGPAPSSLTYRVQLSVNKTIEFQFDFGTEFKGTTAVNALIGPNGIGKTRALHQIAASSSDEPYFRGWPASTVVYTHDRTGFRGKVPRSVSIVSLTPTHAKWKKITNLLFNLAAAHSPFARPYGVLDRLLSDVIPLSNLFFPLKQNVGIYNYTKYFNGIEYVPFVQCMHNQQTRPFFFRGDLPALVINEDQSLGVPSSGEMALFAFLVSILVECDSGSLILIDEPENHLHPQFISMLMQKLNEVLIDTDSRAIVVTHSPFVVRELDRDAVTIMKRDPDGVVTLYAPTLQTHGGNVAMISHYVFGDQHIRKGYERLIDTLLIEGRDRTRQSTQELDAYFGTDAIGYILKKDHDQSKE